MTETEEIHECCVKALERFVVRCEKASVPNAVSDHPDACVIWIHRPKWSKIKRAFGLSENIAIAKGADCEEGCSCDCCKMYVRK